MRATRGQVFIDSTGSLQATHTHTHTHTHTLNFTHTHVHTSTHTRAYTGKNFTEGWVEFADKRVAKRTALLLNSQRIGGKRRSAYYDDLWCIKYLPRFKWDDLTDEIAYQRAVRDFVGVLVICFNGFMGQIVHQEGREWGVM